ncbi:ATP-dependent DNA helicase RecG [Hydrogenophilus islandicus]
MSATPQPRFPLEAWPGIGPAVAARLARLGVQQPEDFLWLLPLRYEDLTRVTPIGLLTATQEALIEGEVVRVEERARTVGQSEKSLVVHLADPSGVIVGRWFRLFPSIRQKLQPGRRWRWYGEVRWHYAGGYEMIHPRLIDPKEPLPATLTPVYPCVDGLNQPQLRRWVAKALTLVPLTEWLDEERRRSWRLPPLPEAVRLLHQPPAGIAPDHPAWRAARARLALDELVAHQASMRRARHERLAWAAPAIRDPAGEAAAAQLQSRLPFALTRAQQRVVAEIAHDLTLPTPMHRLVLGDVGSGKTVVAALAIAQVVGCGYQAALAAPTEILAQQHATKLTPLFEGIAPVALITASTPARERSEWAQRLEAGEAIVVVGTHALLEDRTPLPRLALAVVDEQHRFGVRQRARLREKCAAWRPHLLMMSATPIPRTLAMACYADLDLSFLDELPPGRQPVTTSLLPLSRKGELIARVRAWCAQGKQAYWVCPLIEENEQLSLNAAEAVYAELTAAMPEVSVALLHGRMKQAEKEGIMAAFVAGRVALLVATTVIEVGVDVPNASLMVIEHAERFGLAQLHQLRGRVGRGVERSFCVLLYDEPLSAIARERLATLKRENDGFRIAQTDLQLRGPGELTGVRQSGVPLLRVADLARDEALIPTAQGLADELIARSPEWVERLIARWLPHARWATHA